MLRCVPSRSGFLAHAYVAAITVLAQGCLAPPAANRSDIEVPTLVQYAFDNAETLKSDPDEPLVSRPFDAVLDALNGLDGCWASVLADELTDSAYFDVIEFDTAAGAFTRTSLLASVGGELLADFPVFTVKHGVFEITSETLITLHDRSVAANMDLLGNPLAEAVAWTPSDYHVVRPALVTLSGDRARIALGVDSADDPNASSNAAIYQRIPCRP